MRYTEREVRKLLTNNLNKDDSRKDIEAKKKRRAAVLSGLINAHNGIS